MDHLFHVQQTPRCAKGPHRKFHLNVSRASGRIMLGSLSNKCETNESESLPTTYNSSGQQGHTPVPHPESDPRGVSTHCGALNNCSSIRTIPDIATRSSMLFNLSIPAPMAACVVELAPALSDDCASKVKETVFRAENRLVRS